MDTVMAWQGLRPFRSPGLGTGSRGPLRTIGETMSDYERGSIEAHCRKLIKIAVRWNLVEAADDPDTFSSSELVEMANYLQELIVERRIKRI